MARPEPEVLARHYRQLRTTRGTVLLGPARYEPDGPRADPAWFVDGCPLEPRAAVAAIATRHGYSDPTDALRALSIARDELDARGSGDAAALADLPAGG